jgi:hypothetical protein
MMTNLAYEEDVPERANEMWIGLISQNLKVLIDAYILGTLFHYLVKKDPAAYTRRCKSTSHFSSSMPPVSLVTSFEYALLQ